MHIDITQSQSHKIAKFDKAQDLIVAYELGMRDIFENLENIVLIR